MRFLLAAALLACAAAVPSIPQSHKRHDNAVILLTNGQTQKSVGPAYFDLANNRTRFDDAVQGLTIVSLYNEGKEFGIQGSSCQFCPLSGGLEAFGPASNAAAIGSKVRDARDGRSSEDGRNSPMHRSSMVRIAMASRRTRRWGRS